MKKSAAFLGLLAFTFVSKAQLNISFDYSNLEQTIGFFRNPYPAQNELNGLLQSPGMKVIIKKIRSNDSIARLALEKASRGIKTSGKENDFQYGFIKENITSLEGFMQRIKANETVIKDSIRALSLYLLENQKANVKVVFLAGGYSAGFTLGDDDVFYIGTHQYKNDVTGIINTCQHEMFHTIQELCYNRKAVMNKLQAAKELPALYAYYLGQNIFVEGTAEYVADIDRLDVTTPYMKNQFEHANVNNYRMEDNFYLLEKILMDAFANNEKTNVDIYYRILFDWNWNNPGYQVGKLMTKALVKAHGPMILKKYLTSDPMIFLKDYIELTKSDPKSYPYGFSEAFEKMIDSVVARVAALK